ncbi:hypothetical protein E2320_019819, partial [Naja naja]
GKIYCVLSRTKCRCLLLTKRAFFKTAVSPKNGPSHGYTHKRLEEPISSGVQNYTLYKNLKVQAIVRPKTKTSILQRRRRELGITDASSDEDECSLCQVSGTTRITPATKKGHE